MNIMFQSVFDTPSVAQNKLNSRGITPDGNVWSYLYATEAISQYSCVERPAITGVDTVSSSQNGASQNVYITEGSAGWTTGAYQEHWVVVDAGTGQGQGGKIKDNTTDTLELYSDYAFGTALDVTDSDITIVHWTDAEELDASSANASVNGIAQVAFASADYGWFLIRGIGLVTIGDTAGELNEYLVPGSDSAGGLIGIGNDADREDESIVGKCLVANSTADKATLIEANIL